MDVMHLAYVASNLRTKSHFLADMKGPDMRSAVAPFSFKNTTIFQATP